MADPISAGLMIGGTILSAGGQIMAGQQQKKAADYQANVLEQQAGQDRAASQQSAIERMRQGTLAVSRARALAAASGGGTTDPTVLEGEARLAARGQYNALSTIYSGEEAGRTAENQASVYRYGGKMAQRAGYINAAGTILGGATSLYNKYGGKGPPGVTDYGADINPSGGLVGGGYAQGYS